MTARFSHRLAATCLLAFAAGCTQQLDESSAELDDPELAPQIVGGQIATQGELLATVALVNTHTGSQQCSGTLVGPQVVVTAAHCLFDPQTGQQIQPADVVVGAGQIDLHAVQRWHGVYAVIAHGSYSGTKPSNDPAGLTVADDIGLLVLQDQVTEVQSIAIAAIETVDQLLVPNQPVVISGYGLNGPDSNTATSGVLYIAASPYIRRSETELLVGSPGAPDTCPGDSGGPVYAVAGNEAFFVGATSRAAAGATTLCGEGGIYTLVPAYLPWIDGALAQLGSTTTPPVGTAPGTDPNLPGQQQNQANDDDDDDDRRSHDSGCSVTGGRAGESSGLFALLALSALGAGLRRRRDS